MVIWIQTRKLFQVVFYIRENVTYKVNLENINNDSYNLVTIKKPMGVLKFMPQQFRIHKIDFYWLTRRHMAIEFANKTYQINSS